ncbi:MAG: hypothetical protein J6L81_05355 [Clostridia bacterium]|nr:hypothetical protein [Clostridia bacterium]
MKRIFVALFALCLLLCSCQTAEPAPTNPTLESNQASTQTTTETSADTTTEKPAETTAKETTKPTQTQTNNVTVYLLEKAVFCDNGYSDYFYDGAYNIDTREDYDIENKYRGKVSFVEKDKNGMACMIWEETVTEDVHNLTYFADGKLKEEMLNVNESNYTGWQYEYDQKGDVIEKREYYEGILQSTVVYEYNGETLSRVYCEDPKGNHLYDCRIENGVIVEKVIHSTDSVAGCSYRYEYDSNGNLITEYMFDGELFPMTSYSYKAVKVDAERAEYLKKQQAYLVSIT